jgi:flavin-dependent dehydrogenase
MDAEVDVLIAGAGAAGMTAALVCALNGLDVVLCEKSSQVGGTTATSAGTI